MEMKEMYINACGRVIHDSEYAYEISYHLRLFVSTHNVF
jgi:hypothetical protein